MTIKTPLLLPVSLLCALLLSGCRQDSVVEEPPVPAPASSAPAWLPLHRQPRPGDFAVHRRLDRQGRTVLERRSEVLRVADGLIEVEQRFNRPDSPRRRYRVDARGRVLRAWQSGPDGGMQPLAVAPAARRSTLRVSKREPLPLAAGSFPVSRIVSQSIRLEDGTSGRQVFYLSPAVPFATLVSLSSDRPISHKQAVRLLGRIAVPRGDAAGRAGPAAGKVITSGWVLERWGRARQ